MGTLINKNYDDKYLVMGESNLRVDYLVPFIEDSLFSDNIYAFTMQNDSDFIISNTKQLISLIAKIDKLNDSIDT